MEFMLISRSVIILFVIGLLSILGDFIVLYIIIIDTFLSLVLYYCGVCNFFPHCLGDDAIAVKSGMNMAGILYNKPTSNLTISNLVVWRYLFSNLISIFIVYDCMHVFISDMSD
jgi:hypothetical protein